MKNSSHRSLNNTINFWSNYTGAKLSNEEARQIVENITGFFKVLSEWKAAEKDDPDTFKLSKKTIT
jgi:hypothetical protein